MSALRRLMPDIDFETTRFPTRSCWPAGGRHGAISRARWRRSSPRRIREVFTEMPDVQLGGRRRAGGGQAAAHRGGASGRLRYADAVRRMPACAPPKGILLHGAAGHRQDAAGQGAGRRERGELHLGQGSAAAEQVGRRVGARRARGVPQGAAGGALHRVLRRDRRLAPRRGGGGGERRSPSASSASC